MKKSDPLQILRRLAERAISTRFLHDSPGSIQQKISNGTLKPGQFLQDKTSPEEREILKNLSSEQVANVSIRNDETFYYFMQSHVPKTLYDRFQVEVARRLEYEKKQKELADQLEKLNQAPARKVYEAKMKRLNQTPRERILEDADNGRS